MHHDTYSESGKQLSDMESILKSMSFAQPIEEKKEKKLDPVGKEDDDIDNDGDSDKSDEYLLNRRKVRAKAINKEEYDNTKPDPKVTAEKKARLEKKRGMKLDDHPEYKKEEVEIDEATAMAKRGHDETAIRNKIAKSTGGGKSADRATALADKPTYGDNKAAKQRQDLARKQRGDFRKTTSSSPGLHGYAHKSNDPKVKAKQAARGAQRGALTPNEKKELNREGVEMIGDSLENGGLEVRNYSWREVMNMEGYQRNPEKGEKEDKKYAPVRGEKTPMPPRGDKRREDFEKWYAKNVR